MLSYFPKLYPDELLYSWFARYHDHSKNESPKQTMQELFGNMSTVAVVDLPNNLSAFYENIAHFNPPKINDLIRNHTMYGYYTFFQTNAMKRRAIDYIKHGGKPGEIHMFLGIAASTIKNWQYLRLCSSCIKQDRERYGEAYWHVSHQLSKVHYCHIHQELLHDSNVELRSPHKHEFVSAENADLTTPHLVKLYSSETERYLKRLSNESIHLINLVETIEPKELLAIYKYLMQINGYANHLGKVHQQYFTQQFKRYYGEEFFTFLDCDFDEYSDTSWIRSIVRKHRKAFHPIQHLLLLGFLSISITDLEQFKGMQYEPFGQAPYYCLNSAADHYKNRVISEVTITKCTDTRKPVGTFSCECGFIYSRRGPDRNNTDAFKVGRVKLFGHVWQAKLKELVASGLSYYRIAQILECDYATVKKYADYPKIETSNGDSSIFILKNEKEMEWLNLISKHPDFTITQLRKEAPALYAWHYRNNIEWLKEHSSKGPVRQIVNKRVDWEKRDLEILEQVKKVIKKLYTIEKPIYINKSRTGKEIGQLSLLEKVLDKLPKTKGYLERNLETRQQYQIRRIKWACKKLYLENEEQIVEWKVRRLAGLREGLSSTVETAIRNEIRFYQQGEMQIEAKTMDF
ncbi:TniQ protein [Bacillus mycoides]|uniref:TnsD family Tn7-like transposition protein n=1 Tax=Bacillus mycoides TaxID=1405 RepID=UPI0008DF6DCA|nr:TnsD family Tn7-like transposition protein [Bacillus mycoides]SFQ87199.1 TniQ protein [Bacillus mycoides]